MPTTRANLSNQSSIRSHNCQSIQLFLPTIQIQYCHTNRTGQYSHPIMQSHAGQSTEYIRIILSLVIVGWTVILVAISSQVSLAILASLVFLFIPGSPIAQSAFPSRIWYPVWGVFCGPDAFQEECELALPNRKSRDTRWGEYPIGRS